MEAKKMPTGIGVLKWYYIILGIISCLAGLILPPVVGAIMRAAMTATQDSSALPLPVAGVTGVVLAIYGVFVVCWGIFEILIGINLGRGNGWARIAAIVVGIISLLSIPIGTVLGILCLVFLNSDEGKAYFKR
jgi:uncharacterized membrane protein HdeD (DUF308 family)